MSHSGVPDTFFLWLTAYLCSLHGVHLIGCASYSLQQICASYTVCILHCVHHHRLLSRSDSAAINASVQCRGATRCISTPSVHHHLRSRHPSNTSVGRIEHDALYICVWCSEYSSICRATWCISAWYLDIISASAAVPGGASPNHDQTPLIGLMHLISSPQCEGVKHICSKCLCTPYVILTPNIYRTIMLETRCCPYITFYLPLYQWVSTSPREKHGSWSVASGHNDTKLCKDCSRYLMLLLLTLAGAAPLVPHTLH